ncbi:MAG: hypothetical protein GTO45_00200 [Candidatus Aminicenantes bacterium]|nr:hypothetical protein [Candidatus Aminicenantes bacterium]NIM77188.1 hypothetical protein [Candidatus Aminicenantes bacterium]NIN16481.1 hypothetical protein [Candidatus Aminicenantes bacterium]NIN40342.1 hypothetical protein [Candidatus Aminicenantes bacterium]NIN83161.1 hypothetical protein [Candidatus Aminicenantes bacterium]
MKKIFLIGMPVFLIGLLFFSFSMTVFTIVLMVLLLLWAVTFFREGAYDATDIPILILLMGTLCFGRAFSLMGIHAGRIPIYVTELAAVVSLGLLLLKRKSPGKLWQAWRPALPKELTVGLAAYFLMGILYLVIGVMGNGSAALRDITFCFYIVFLFIGLSLLENPVKVQNFLGFLLPGVIILMVMSVIIFFVYVPGATIFRQLFKDIKMTNLGLYHGLILIFGLSFFTSDRVAGKAGKWLLGLLLYLSFLFIIMAEVRAAWAGLLVALVLMGFLLKKEMKIFILIFLLMIPSFLIIDYFDLGVQKDKLASLKEQVTTIAKRRVHTMPAANIKWRLGIWRQTIKEIREYPIFGWGYGTQIDYVIWKQRLSWLKAIGANTGVLPPHNHLLAITYKMGVLGLLLFLFINFMIFFRGLFYIKKCKSEFNRRFLIASLAGLVYWHGMAFFFDVLESPPTGIFLWIILGAILGVVYLDRRSFQKE